MTCFVYFSLRMMPFQEIPIPLNLMPKKMRRGQHPMVIDFSLFSIVFISGKLERKHLLICII